MQPRFEIFKEKKLVGQGLKTTLTYTKIAELRKRLMLRLNKIQPQISNDLHSIQLYDLQYFV